MRSTTLFTDLSEAVRRPPEWVIPNVLPVGLVILGAPPKTFKSTITAALACVVTRHQVEALPRSLRQPGLHGKAYIFSYEADAGELRDMVETGLKVKLEADSNIYVADDPFVWRLDDPDSRKKLLAELDADEENKPRLVVLDPLVNFHSLDEKDAGDMVRMIAPLRRWAINNEATILLVHHTRKPSESHTTYDALDLRGSGALFGLVDGVIMLTPKKNATHFKAVFKRGQSWEADIRLGIFGAERGLEYVRPGDIEWLRWIQQGSDPHARMDLEKRCGLWVSARHTLLRNVLIDNQDRITKHGIELLKGTLP